MLRKEARHSGHPCGSTRTDAILHLSSPPVQEELATIARFLEVSTLDVERKHNYDRRAEAPTVTSVAKASRDSFVRQWRTFAPARETESRIAAAKAANRKLCCANVVSVAYAANPDLFPQAVGKLKWERPKRLRAQRRRREGSGRPSGYTTDLEAVLAEHGDEYRAEARRRRVSIVSIVRAWKRDAFTIL